MEVIAEYREIIVSSVPSVRSVAIRLHKNFRKRASGWKIASTHLRIHCFRGALLTIISAPLHRFIN
jgi:hypothetical protein